MIKQLNKIVYLNWHEVLKLHSISDFFIYFYKNIKNNKNEILFNEVFFDDLKFLSKKLICIINNIKEIEKETDLNVISIYFCILKEDRNEFLIRNFDISNFWILPKNNIGGYYKFSCRLIKANYLNSKYQYNLGIYMSITYEQYTKLFNDSIPFDNILLEDYYFSLELFVRNWYISILYLNYKNICDKYIIYLENSSINKNKSDDLLKQEIYYNKLKKNNNLPQLKFKYFYIVIVDKYHKPI